MSEVSEEAVDRAIEVFGYDQYSPTRDEIRAALEAALPYLGGEVAERVEQQQRICELEDAMRKSLRHMEDCEDRNDRAVVEAWDVIASALDAEVRMEDE